MKNDQDGLKKHYSQIYEWLVQAREDFFNGKENDSQAFGLLLHFFSKYFKKWIVRLKKMHDIDYDVLFDTEDLCGDVIEKIFRVKKNFFLKSKSFDDPNLYPEEFIKWTRSVLNSYFYDVLRINIKRMYDASNISNTKKEKQNEISYIVKTLATLFYQNDLLFPKEIEEIICNEFLEEYTKYFTRRAVITDAAKFEDFIYTSIFQLIEVANEKIHLDGKEWINQEEVRLIKEEINNGGLIDCIAVLVSKRKGKARIHISIEESLEKKTLIVAEDIEHSELDDEIFGGKRNLIHSIKDNQIKQCMFDIVHNNHIPIEKRVFWIAYTYGFFQMSKLSEREIREVVYELNKDNTLLNIILSLVNIDAGPLSLTKEELYFIISKLSQYMILQSVSKKSRDQNTFPYFEEMDTLVFQNDMIEKLKNIFKQKIDHAEIKRIQNFIKIPNYYFEKRENVVQINKEVEKNTKKELIVNKKDDLEVKKQLDLLNKLIYQIDSMSELIENTSIDKLKAFVWYPKILAKEKRDYTLEECLGSKKELQNKWIKKINNILLEKDGDALWNKLNSF